MAEFQGFSGPYAAPARPDLRMAAGCNLLQRTKDPGNILIVDTTNLATEVSPVLSEERYRILAATDGREGLRVFQQERPDAVMLDTCLPGGDGFHVLRSLHSQADTPVAVSDLATEDDAVRSFDLGADDYLVKPLRPRELLARIRALQRRRGQGLLRAATQGQEDLSLGGIILSPRRHEVVVHESRAHLTPLEFKIRWRLMLHADEVIHPRSLVEYAWGYEGDGDEDLVRVHISRLRKKLASFGDAARHLLTVPGYGYKFQVWVD